MKKNHNNNYEYVCPHCGNEAPYILKLDTEKTCYFCKRKYTRDERIKVKKER